MIDQLTWQLASGPHLFHSFSGLNTRAGKQCMCVCVCMPASSIDLCVCRGKSLFFPNHILFIFSFSLFSEIFNFLLTIHISEIFMEFHFHARLHVLRSTCECVLACDHCDHAPTMPCIFPVLHNSYSELINHVHVHVFHD